ncbi:MAG: inositol-3-phosphate synthase [Bradymonadales bacterium]|jgi:myo-inositol-1-phosphate synthase
MTKKGVNIKPASGKLGVLIPGLGAVSSTLIAGVFDVLRGHGKPIGSVTQMGTIRLGKRTDGRSPLIKDFVPLAPLKDLVFGGWDVHGENVYEVCKRSAVLKNEDLEPLKAQLEAIKPMDAVFDKAWVHNLEAPHVKSAATKYDLAMLLVQDMKRFKAEHGVDRLVMIWCGSTEVHTDLCDAHLSTEKFVQALKDNHEAISPSMIYAYAAIISDVPYINGAPNLAVDTPALRELARERKVAIAGKDFKTGQTLMKTILAPGFRARSLGLNGWYSTNILGNRDGEVLNDPGSFKSKEVTKLSVLEHILDAEQYPELYGNFQHKVRIDYYPPRGDDKEGWDNIDIFGWLGYPMQIKVNFLCRDSILAAPVALDLVLLTDLAQRAGFYGIQEWLSFYFKSPQTKPGLYPEHDIFVQKTKMKNTLRYMMGEELITHLGLEYYAEED